MHRWYRGGWGRYTQGDVLGLGGGRNLYAYAGDDPTGAIDPLGEATINVTKVGEQTYSTQAAYQTANPCHVNGVSFACTERLVQSISCPCKCVDQQQKLYAMDVTATVQEKYHLAGGPPNAPHPPAWYWSGYRQHEDLHFNDLITQLTAYANKLEANRYHSMQDCNIECGKTIAGFTQWMNAWAIDSNKRLH